MARKTMSRMEMRRQAEAADASGAPPAEGEAKATKSKEGAAKKKAAPRARRTKTKAQVRKRLVWGVFSSSMKEEGRFLYAEREAADAKAATLAEKHKRKFFVQQIKEIIGEKPMDLVEADLEDDKPVRAKKRRREEDEEEPAAREDDDFEMPEFGDDDDDD